MSVRIKICGITREQDAADASSLGADAIGIVFYPPSPRYVADLSLAKTIAQAAGPFVTVVGLFVDASPDDIERTLSTVPLHVLQFHGNETHEQCILYERPFYKALRMRDDIDLKDQMAAYPQSTGFLLDTYVKGTPGGTGEAFNWHRVPKDTGVPIIVAGGLKAANVAQAIQQSRPYGVDVSGGVEAEPGVKSKALMKAFVSRVKSQE